MTRESAARRIANRPRSNGRHQGFTLVELLVVIGVLGLLAGILLPALSKSKSTAQSTVCLNNTKQLILAWLMYADEHDDRLAYNLGGDASLGTVAPKSPMNWVNNVMTWELDSDNTNTTTITEASLASYASDSINIYRCPADDVLSEIQRQAGWTARIRSYSMNAMVGHAGWISKGGTNVNNPDYVQFFTLSQIPSPTDIFVFLDEHPDSINDGYFLNQPDNLEWMDLPASYHNGGASFSFADGHSELHRWVQGSTKQPARPDGAQLPLPVPSNERADFDWLSKRVSIER